MDSQAILECCHTKAVGLIESDDVGWAGAKKGEPKEWLPPLKWSWNAKGQKVISSSPGANLDCFSMRARRRRSICWQIECDSRLGLQLDWQPAGNCHPRQSRPFL
jgi:hypothetical protein